MALVDWFSAGLVSSGLMGGRIDFSHLSDYDSVKVNSLPLSCSGSLPSVCWLPYSRDAQQPQIHWDGYCDMNSKHKAARRCCLKV